MTWTLIANASAGFTSSGSGCTTSPIDTTGADLIVVGSAWFTDQPTLTDSNGNTWTQLTTQADTNGDHSALYYCVSPTVGSGHTFSLSAGGFSFSTLWVAAFSGVDTSAAFDLQAGNGSSSSVAGSYTTASITPSQNGDLVVSLVATVSAPVSGGFTVDSGFSHVGDQVHSQCYGGSLGYLFQGTAGPESPTWTWSGSSFIVAPLAAFKGTGGTSSFLAAWAAGRNRVIEGMAS